jgi:hypothetical protein
MDMTRKDFLREFTAKRPVKMYYVYNYKVCSCNVKNYTERQRTDEFMKSQTYAYLFRVDGNTIEVNKFPKSCITNGCTAYYWNESDAKKDLKEEIKAVISDYEESIAEAEREIRDSRKWAIGHKKDITEFKKKIASLKKLL